MQRLPAAHFKRAAIFYFGTFAPRHHISKLSILVGHEGAEVDEAVAQDGGEQLGPQQVARPPNSAPLPSSLAAFGSLNTRNGKYIFHWFTHSRSTDHGRPCRHRSHTLHPLRRPPDRDKPRRAYFPVGDAVFAAAVLHQPQVAARHPRLAVVILPARLGRHHLPLRRQKACPPLQNAAPLPHDHARSLLHSRAQFPIAHYKPLCLGHLKTKLHL